MIETTQEITLAEENSETPVLSFPQLTFREMLTCYTILSLLLSVASAMGRPGWMLFWFLATPVILLTLLTVMQWPIFWFLRRVGLFDREVPVSRARRPALFDTRDAFPSLPRDR